LRGGVRGAAGRDRAAAPGRAREGGVAMSAALLSHSALVDTVARDSLPPGEEGPDLLVEEAGLSYPERLNCAVALLDDQVAAGNGDRPAFVTPHQELTYRQLPEGVD